MRCPAAPGINQRSLCVYMRIARMLQLEDDSLERSGGLGRPGHALRVLGFAGLLAVGPCWAQDDEFDIAELYGADTSAGQSSRDSSAVSGSSARVPWLASWSSRRLSPSASSSQASPKLSRSRLCWSALGTRGQLSA